MAETTVKSNGGSEPPHKDFSSQHRVKKLLETYIGSAGRSLTGPAGSEMEAAMYRKTYKLPPDVEISKTQDEDNGQPYHYEKPALQRRHSRSPDVRVRSPTPNGMVTLSRVDPDDVRARTADPDRSRHRSTSSSSAPDARHLSGEMIRRLREQQKAERHAAEPMKVRPAAVAKTFEQFEPQFKTPSAGPPVVQPIFSARDPGVAEMADTIFHGEKIACFTVGGEPRLCLPQILNTVLDSVSLPAIHQACDDLQIYCSTCTHGQLDVLKSNKVLPITAFQCGLITKSDAERLCSLLLDRNVPRASVSSFNAKTSPFSFRVQHDCFGQGSGILLPEAFTSPTARCIECLECEGLFSPQRFVCHSHRSANRTCHWGFDSNNWRFYIQVSEQYSESDREKLDKLLNDIKNRYNNKRKQPETLRDPIPPTAVIKEETLSPSHPKKSRLHSTGSNGAPSPAVVTTAPFFPANGTGDPYNLFYNWAAAAKTSGTMNPAAAAYMAAAAAAAVKVKKANEGKPGPPWGFAPPSNFPFPPVTVSHVTLPPRPKPEPVDPPSQHSPVMKASPPVDPVPVSFDVPPPDVPRRPPLPLTLADEISAIREALEGASSAARERTLKTLERLTQRLASAETERDRALTELVALQKRFRATEEELQKKRAELRELLTQDEPIRQSNPPKHDPVELVRTSSKPNSVTMELLPRSRSVQSNGSQVLQPNCNGRSALPKIELKSPARVIAEEKERGSSSSRGSSITGNGNPSCDSPTTIREESDSGFSSREIDRRRQSGTPLSVKSKDSEDLRERMLTMESELRALREALSQRPALRVATPPTTTPTDTPPSSEQPPLSEKPDPPRVKSEVQPQQPSPTINATKT